MKTQSKAANVAWMVVVVLLWAICFPFIVTGLPDAPPLLFAALRAFLAGGLLFAVHLVQRRREPYPFSPRDLGLLSLIGLSYTAMGFGGMFLAAGHLSPGLATVLASTQPLIAAAIAAAWLGETLKTKGIAGLVIGFLGVTLLSWSGFDNNNAGYLWGITWVLVGAIGIAIGNILLKKRAGGSVAAPMAVQLLIGGGILLLASAVGGEQWEIRWTFRFTGSLLILSALATAAMMYLWFALLARAPLNRLNVFSFLTPALGLLIGFIFFEERLQPVQILGIIVVIVGIAMMQGRGAVAVAAADESATPP
ncbi:MULTISPECIES: DMT family transporter [Gammaproteobacteria]|jgi:drug/metabolite transporter (DMT)-like permease|uniref:DMT family transporter n=1 Tax=Gammaproteobacteria TaxID=1236 RepID=UPI000C640E89|nr:MULTISPECIES: DMT family transporter [Gammaproteobacteria]MAN53130.1 EamA family transporter [Marinimicrobium sp.]UZJ44378.1 DMT family transporter [Marinimicrobium sp. C6131]|tara:strand:- start:1417 stop:2340 length:924 start_codon:yes stop_codon:yes gene_type:complete